MDLKRIFFITLFFGGTVLFAENYLINGGQESQINYLMVQKIEPARGTKKLLMSYVVPTSFGSPTYQQRISKYNIIFSERPNSRRDYIDDRGNKIVRVVWNRPRKPIETTISIQAQNTTSLKALETMASFPIRSMPVEIQAYLASTSQTPANDPMILSTARKLTRDSETVFDAVQNILAWVVDHMTYVLIPQQYDAMYSFQTGKGNCQNYSHLSASLMRAVGIPARIVNGVTLKEPYEIETPRGTFTMKMAQGRHSWIEVWFPDLGWVPFDPQQTALYVSNRFIRIEVGVDNDDTSNDGLVRWSMSRGYRGKPGFEELIHADFKRDQVKLLAERQDWGPAKLLFYPEVQSEYTRSLAQVQYSAVQTVSPQEMNNASFNHKSVTGNLEFPENISFIETRGPATSVESENPEDEELEMRKNFLVETAEYVTTQGTQYAQTFILNEPTKLESAALALHKFGGSGQLWLELYKDDGNGKPGEYISTSEYMPVKRMPQSQGYSWIDFAFGNGTPPLSPGRYWLALGFTGSPVINWFYTYGKSVGPIDGTRYKTLFDDTWNRSLTFEFNYRITGLTP